MLFQVCSVRDAVAEEYQGLMLEISEQAAIRSFSSSVLTSRARETGLLYSNPKDFSLWKLGEFDSVSGEFALVQPKRLIEAGEVHD